MGTSKPTKICPVEGCERPSRSRGWCMKHYVRWQKTGNPLLTHGTVPGEPLKFLKSLFDYSDECVQWPYCIDPVSGYGKLTHNGAKHTVGRVALLLQGPPPFKGAVAGHLCKTKPCCNPWHFEWITDYRNLVDDKIRDGTFLKGSQIGNSKLTDIDVLAIREEYANGATQYDLADKFRTTQSNISKVVRRESWKHI